MPRVNVDEADRNMARIGRTDILALAARRMEGGTINGLTLGQLRGPGKRRFGLGQVLLGVIDARDEHFKRTADAIGMPLSDITAMHKLRLPELKAMAKTIYDADSLTFEHFIKSARKTDDAAGDLIGDMRRDYLETELMPYFTTADSVRLHLLPRSACDGAMAAVDAVFARYQRHCELVKEWG